MRLIGKKKLEKLKLKNRGNAALAEAIHALVDAIENADWPNEAALKRARPDADKVHPDGFYFFDLHVHRTMILVEFDREGEATVVWAGNHAAYERTFQNNKNTIRRWLKNNDYIS